MSRGGGCLETNLNNLKLTTVFKAQDFCSFVALKFRKQFDLLVTVCLEMYPSMNIHEHRNA